MCLTGIVLTVIWSCNWSTEAPLSLWDKSPLNYSTITITCGKVSSFIPYDAVQRESVWWDQLHTQPQTVLQIYHETRCLRGDPLLRNISGTTTQWHHYFFPSFLHQIDSPSLFAALLWYFYSYNEQKLSDIVVSCYNWRCRLMFCGRAQLLFFS